MSANTDPNVGTIVPEVGAHTPGPWYATGRQVMQDGVGLSSIVPLAKCFPRIVGPQRISPAEAEANARLIAAAPDLLAALKDAAEVLENEIASSCNLCDGEGGWDEQERMTPVVHREGCAYAAARSAIRKAVQS